MQSGDFILKARVLADGEGFSFALREWKLCVRRGEWIVRSSLGTYAAPFRPGEWHEIAFVVDDQSAKGGAQEKRRILVCVDRRPLGERGCLDGVVENLTIESGPEGGVVGAVEWSPR
jgi:hypothetical protein